MFIKNVRFSNLLTQMTTREELLSSAAIAQTVISKKYHTLREHATRSDDETILQCIAVYNIVAEQPLDPEGYEQKREAVKNMGSNERKNLLYNVICGAAASRDFAMMTSGMSRRNYATSC